jgi:gamma-glutamyltranspeptidase
MIRSTLVVTKQTPFARNGMVAAEHRRGAEVGAGILARGGNAVDAAVATAFAMTVIEPFMSTIAVSGTMLVHLVRKGETLALNFNGLAPLAGHETLYKVVGGVSDGLFSWPRTENSAKGAEVMVSSRVGDKALAGLAKRGHKVDAKDESYSTLNFARPVAIRVTPKGLEAGCEQYSAASAAGH